MRRLWFVLACFRGMGATYPQLAKDFIRLMFDKKYRQEWYHDHTWHT